MSQHNDPEYYNRGDSLHHSSRFLTLHSSESLNDKQAFPSLQHRQPQVHKEDAHLQHATRRLILPVYQATVQRNDRYIWAMPDARSEPSFMQI